MRLTSIIFSLASLTFPFLCQGQVPVPGTNGQPNKKQMEDKAMEDKMVKPTLSAQDKMFFRMAYQGGLAVRVLGQLASVQGNSTATKIFGNTMVVEHGKVNDLLKDWAMEMNMKAPSNFPADSIKVKKILIMKTGKNFDLAYARLMVTDHKKDIAMFDREIKMGRNPKLVQIAKDTLPKLKMHLKMAQKLPM